ncbi:hypothetical protein FB566_2160 [Stackebrandtia endophytica]|uniref:Uncharacterized protein n=1 Tax=Stackebrandtia endophytica TaxID=1496996 RepID=A0A543AVM7_9ACTN|nr:hypothetical protein [Stackebrandtia endophytica]TQL76627.1 hypothetical protein FB566_2160 [Stackebrandtia endophytica]
MTEDDVRWLWRKAWFGYLLLLTAVASVAFLFGLSETPIVVGVIAAILLSFGYWFWFRTLLPLPHLVREERDAVVTGVRREKTSEDVTPGYFLVVELTVTRADGSRRDTDLADLVADRDLDRFTVGSQWMVYLFRDTELAVLAERHDDVWRHGHILYRVSGWAVQGLTPYQGSKILKRRFRSD